MRDRLTPMIKFEPMPKNALPKDLQEYPDVVANELYKYRTISRGPARVFNIEFENTLRASSGTKNVAFHLHDAALYFAKAAGEGVIGNLAYAALVKAISSIRRPRREFPRAELRFEAVISRRSYTRQREKHHPETAPIRKVSPALNQKLETEYRLMVRLIQSATKKSALKKPKGVRQ